MATSKSTKKAFYVQIDAKIVTAVIVHATDLDDALAQSKELKLGTILAEGEGELQDWNARVSGIYEVGQ